MTRGEFTKRAIFTGGGAMIWILLEGRITQPPLHHWTIPHVRPRPPHPGTLAVTNIEANVSIKGQIATTELLLGFRNPGGRAMEGRALLPVPTKATLKSEMRGGESMGRKRSGSSEHFTRVPTMPPTINPEWGLGLPCAGVWPGPLVVIWSSEAPGREARALCWISPNPNWHYGAETIRTR